MNEDLIKDRSIQQFVWPAPYDPGCPEDAPPPATPGTPCQKATLYTFQCKLCYRFFTQDAALRHFGRCDDAATNRATALRKVSRAHTHYARCWHNRHPPRALCLCAHMCCSYGPGTTHTQNAL